VQRRHHPGRGYHSKQPEGNGRRHRWRREQTGALGEAPLGKLARRRKDSKGTAGDRKTKQGPRAQRGWVPMPGATRQIGVSRDDPRPGGGGGRKKKKRGRGKRSPVSAASEARAQAAGTLPTDRAVAQGAHGNRCRAQAGRHMPPGGRQRAGAPAPGNQRQQSGTSGPQQSGYTRATAGTGQTGALEGNAPREGLPVSGKGKIRASRPAADEGWPINGGTARHQRRNGTPANHNNRPPA